MIGFVVWEPLTKITKAFHHRHGKIAVHLGRALAMTLGVFLPAFLFSLLFYHHLEAVICNPLLRHFLEGMTAGVVGLIAVTTLSLAWTAIPNWRAALIFAAALFVVYRWKTKLAVPAIVLGAGIAGWVVF